MSDQPLVVHPVTYSIAQKDLTACIKVIEGGVPAVLDLLKQIEHLWSLARWEEMIADVRVGVENLEEADHYLGESKVSADCCKSVQALKRKLVDRITPHVWGADGFGGYWCEEHADNPLRQIKMLSVDSRGDARLSSFEDGERTGLELFPAEN